MPTGWLVIERGGERTRVPLRDGEQTLGRAADNDIVLGEPYVSRRHARVAWRQGLPVLVDTKSTYGLTAGGRRVPEVVLAPGQIAVIQGPAPGDVLHLSYELAVAEAAPAAPPPAGELLTGPPTGFMRLGTADEHITIGRDAGNALVLDHPQVSRLHAVLETRDGAATLSDRSVNGTYVNGKRVSGQRVLKAGDRIRIACYELEFDGRRLIQYDQARRARLDALDLSCTVEGGTSILHATTFSALPTELIAIVGSSGAGKTTLLDALSGCRPASNGTVLVNGRDYYREFASLRLLVGYVPQSDVVHRELTAQRALTYAARLRLPSDTSEAEGAARVQQVLDEVGLAERAAIPVARLSGGQIKRVSVGVELLTRPSLFFLDEPTSGLDPGNEQRLMELLRSLATEGRTILFVTHSTQHLERCDHVAFMAPGGWLAFFGPPREALAYFECPDYPSIYARLQQGGDGAELAARFVEHRAYRDHVLARLPDTGAPASEVGGAPAALAATGAAPVSGRRQFAVLVRRYAETLANDRRSMALLLLQAPIIGVLAALVAKPDTFLALPDASGSRTLLVILSCSMIWLGAMNAAREVVKELPIYLRERMVGLGLAPYLASKYVVLGALCLVQAALLLTLVLLRAPLPAAGLLIAAPVEVYATLGLSAGAGLALGLLISTLFTNADRATALVPYLLIPQIIFVVADLDGPGKVLSWLAASHWSVQALGATVNLAQFSAPLTGLDTQDYPHDAHTLLLSWLILLAMAAVCTAASFALLKRRDGTLM